MGSIFVLFFPKTCSTTHESKKRGLSSPASNGTPVSCGLNSVFLSREEPGALLSSTDDNCKGSFC